MVVVKRSPCRVSWWVMFDSALLDVKHSKGEAEDLAAELNRKYKHVL